MARFLAHAERFNTEIVFDHIHTAKLAETADPPDRRQRRIHLRRADHRHRRQRDVPRPAVRAGVHGQAAFRAARPATASSTRDQDVAVVGGGNTAVEEALYLANIAKKVTLIHRRDKFRAEPILVDHLMDKVKEGRIELKLYSVLDEVLGDDSGVTGIRIKQHAHRRDAGPRAAGRVHRDRPPPEHRDLRRPARDGERLHHHEDAASSGMATATSVPGVFAAGDVQDHVYRQAITSAGTGCMAALDAQRYLENQAAGNDGSRAGAGCLTAARSRQWPAP